MKKQLLILVTCVLMAHGGTRSKMPIEPSDETYILAAMDAQIRQKQDLASQYFKYLYEKTGKKGYLYDSLRMYESTKDSGQFMKQTHAALEQNPKDKTLLRFHIVALLKEGKYSEASHESLVLSQETKEASDYLLSAEALLKMANYESGYAELKKAYDISYDEETAERMALIMYTKLDQKQEAIRFLKEHIGTHGNSKILGKRLGSLYADSGALESASETYEAVYELSNDPLIAQEAIRIYVYQQSFQKLIVLLEKSAVNDPLLLELYIRDKQFKKASALAGKLYEHDANPLHLAQSAVFKYEAASDRNDSQLLNQVVEGLKQANEQFQDPVYLNYLGYLMIEHDLGVDEGIVYVQKALEKQPDSAFYLDSLAWGKYKMGECAEALRLIKQVESKVGTDEQEVNDHIKAIQQCKTKDKR